jgi:hypothetical protein
VAAEKFGTSQLREGDPQLFPKQIREELPPDRDFGTKSDGHLRPCSEHESITANGMRLKLQQGTNLNADHYWNCCVFRRRNLLAWDIRKNANEVPCTWSSRLYPGCPWFNAQVSATHSRRKGPEMASDSMAVVHPFGSRRLDQPSSLGHLHEIASPIAQRKALTSSRSSA